MAKVAVINAEKCDNSPFCPVMRVCPQGAVVKKGAGAIASFFGGGKVEIESEKCTGCGVCVRSCPRGAVIMSGK